MFFLSKSIKFKLAFSTCNKIATTTNQPNYDIKKRYKYLQNQQHSKKKGKVVQRMKRFELERQPDEMFGFTAAVFSTEPRTTRVNVSHQREKGSGKLSATQAVRSIGCDLD